MGNWTIHDRGFVQELKLRLASVLGMAALAAGACTNGDAPPTATDRAARAFENAGSAAQAVMPGLGTPVVHDTGRGAIVARAQQRVDDVEVFRGGLNVVMSRTLSPVTSTGFVAENLEHGTRGFEKSAAEAMRSLAVTMLTAAGTRGAYERFTGPGGRAARAKRVYFPHKGGIEPAWYVELQRRAYVVSAITGKTLFENDLVSYEAATYRVFASPDTMIPFDGPQGNGAVPLVVPLRNGFKPAPVAPPLVTLTNYPFSKNDPWLPPGCQTTSGNNVHAYSDVSRPDGFTPNSRDTFAPITSPQTFDYPFDPAVSAGTTDNAVKSGITQFFYTTNFLHDWFYDSGFDEKSGNPQLDNFGRGGAASDPLFAETDDFSGRNNANAYTPADGDSPVIQMFLFSGTVNASLTVAAPATNAGVKPVGVTGEFGADAFTVSSTAVFANDGVGVDPDDACEALPSSVAGQIVVANRGNCSFVEKATSAQNAGAAGLVIVNLASSPDPTTPPFLGGTALELTIPVLSLNLADGQALATAIPGGVTLTMQRDPSQNIDGALDNQIVTHEWGHVLSNRLIADGSGLDTPQARALGEGWSDFVAMLLSVRADDLAVPANANWSGVYPTATYSTSGDSEFYFGIRRVPYSTDLTKDPLTFKHISNGNALPANVPTAFGEDGSSNAEVHNAGEVWATMLWEGYAALLNSGVGFAEAQTRMKGYLVASLKMTPPSPTFIEARDALLATAYASSEQDFLLFWKAFAKRGAGVGAIGPSRGSFDNAGVVESFEVGNAASLVSFGLTDDVLSCDHDGFVDEGEIGTLQVTLRNTGSGTLSATKAIVTSTSKALSFVDSNAVTFDAFKPFETKTAKLKVMLDGTSDVAPLVLDIEVNDPSFVSGQSILLTLAAHHGVDEVAQSSTTDDVEPDATAWTVTAQDVTGTSEKWHRVAKGTNHSWFVPNAEESADHRLTSPPLLLSGNQFTLSWRHRWSFESSTEKMLDFDGGVVEISLDAGKTWDDLSTYATMDYNTKLADVAGATMALRGRPAYGGTSVGYPLEWTHSSITVTVPEPRTTVLVRFRHGADDNTGSVGWEIDDIAVTPLDNLPFTSFVPQRSQCDDEAPSAVAPPGERVMVNDTVSLTGHGSSPKGVPVSLSWRQDAGPAVTLDGRDTPTITFVAPAVSQPTTLVFSLYASDGTLVGAPAQVEVVVDPEGSDSSCGCRVAGARGAGGGAAALVGLALLLARRRSRYSDPLCDSSIPNTTNNSSSPPTTSS